MKATVDRETCIGCGLCTSTCPDVFALDDEGKSKVLIEPIPQQSESCTELAKEECPVSAITVE